MLAEKQKIVSALDKMTSNEIQNLWGVIQKSYLPRTTPTWDNIPTNTPTKEERAILDAINEDDENFISQDALLEKLGLTASDFA